MGLSRNQIEYLNESKFLPAEIMIFVNRLRKYFPLWSEIHSILNSIYGRATTLIAFVTPMLYLFFLPDQFLVFVKIMSGGALMVIISNFLFICTVPSVQRNYPRYLEYETKCLKLEKINALDIFEEFGQVTGEQIERGDWLRSGLSYEYLVSEDKIPSIEDYKVNFERGHGKKSSEINRMALARSLSAIKYVTYDSSKVYKRMVVSILLYTGIAFMYLPAFYRLINLVGS